MRKPFHFKIVTRNSFIFQHASRRSAPCNPPIDCGHLCSYPNILSARIGGTWLVVLVINYGILLKGRTDLVAFEKHVLRMALAGVSPVLSGSLSEAIHLSHAERSTLIKTARKALDNAGLDAIPIISGIGAGSTRECIEFAIEAADAGADCAISICSGYFAGVLAADKKALKAFWTDISQKSPIPVMMYNCEHTFHVHDTCWICFRPGSCWGNQLGF